MKSIKGIPLKFLSPDDTTRPIDTSLKLHLKFQSHCIKRFVAVPSIVTSIIERQPKNLCMQVNKSFYAICRI